MSKRKHVTLTLSEKCAILDRLEKGEKGYVVAKDYDVGTSTISDIRKHSKGIREFVAKCGEGPSRKRRTSTKVSLRQIDEAVHTWYLQRQSHGDEITEAQILAKAKDFQEQLSPELTGTFIASRGWLTTFENKHGIRIRHLHGPGLKNEDHDHCEFAVGQRDEFLTVIVDESCRNGYESYTARPTRPNSRRIKEEKANWPDIVIQSPVPDSETDQAVKHKDAIAAFDLCIKWAEERDVKPEKILVLKDLRKEAANHAEASKQRKITDYFS